MHPGGAMQPAGIIQIGTKTNAGPGENWLGAIRHYLFRRIWLPRGLYAAVPILYLVTGGLALWSAWSLPGWRWIHSLFAILGFACLNAGLSIVLMRLRSRRRQSAAMRLSPAKD
jgi:hypothetical protein